MGCEWPKSGKMPEVCLKCQLDVHRSRAVSPEEQSMTKTIFRDKTKNYFPGFAGWPPKTLPLSPRHAPHP